MIKSMDLSQFVDKEVHITLRNGEEYVTTLKKNNPHYGQITYPYYFVHPSGVTLSYTVSGLLDLNSSLQRSTLDIIKIKLRNPEPMTEPLKDETMRTMVRCLTPEAIRYIEGHEKYAELIFSLFDEFMKEKIGDVNEQIKGDMSCFFMDGISIKAV